MNVPNPVIYTFVVNAWEKYRRDENLPVQSLPSQVPEDGVSIGIVRRLAQMLRSFVSQRRPVQQMPRLGGVQWSATR